VDDWKAINRQTSNLAEELLPGPALADNHRSPTQDERNQETEYAAPFIIVDD